ncbi:hypothetical protein N136_01705 [Leifsonia aquatica ATCC 14665]|uniref:Uncharacterized protein n=1 Tax=Leifsonia aquatica ATCC 14665 TaxID=1358026 RepID=U2T3B7_LEIAQ|nr:hypothetical protein N136_01705 [Leifsonia aquatica ATCC 14665]
MPSRPSTRTDPRAALTLTALTIPQPFVIWEDALPGMASMDG